jgi:hypothetical protein
VLTSMFLFGGGLSGLTSQTPEGQQDTKKEIADAVNAISRGLESLNADSLFRLYANSPDFVLFMTDGSVADYQTAWNHHRQWFKSLSVLKVSTVSADVRVMSGTMAVCAWRGKFDMTSKPGGHLQADFGVTFLFVKKDDGWKVAYQQTAQMPPAQAR